MNTFAGSITFGGQINTKDLLFHSVINQVPLGTNIFLYGKTEFSSSQEVIDFVKQKISGKIISYDISIETEDRIQLSSIDSITGKYHFVAFHGKTFEEVLKETTKLTGQIIAIREAEESNKFGGRVIKVDTITQ